MMMVKTDSRGRVLKEQPTKQPTPKVKSQTAGTVTPAVVVGLANELGVNLSWLLDKPILLTLICAALGLAAGWLKRDRA